MKHSGIIAIVFVIGCATGGVAAQLVVPPVRAGTSPTRWEYKCAEVEDWPDRGGLTPILNNFGEEGWDIASMQRYDSYRYMLCLKRPLP